MCKTDADVWCTGNDRPLLMGFASKISDSIGDSAGGIIAGAIGGGIDYASAKALARTQFKNNKEMYQHRFQWSMDDMKKAGLNPILAAGAGLGGGGSATTGLQRSTPGTTAIMAMRMQAELGQIRANTAKTVEETKNLEQFRTIKGPLETGMDWLGDQAASLKQKIEAGASTAKQYIREGKNPWINIQKIKPKAGKAKLEKLKNDRVKRKDYYYAPRNGFWGRYER